MTKEKFKTYNGVFDKFTLKTLEKLKKQGYFYKLESPISIGKEAAVFTGKTKEGRIIIKISRLETADFNRMFEYIRLDDRFKKVRKKKRYVIFAWVQREYRNLLNARESGITAPIPITFKNNVLIEEFIGDVNPAQKLKDAKPKNLNKFYTLVIKEIKKLYKHNLVHGDLSAYNILNHKEKPVFIDFSQTTTNNNPDFIRLLKRDIKSVLQYFNKHGIKTKLETVLEEIK